MGVRIVSDGAVAALYCSTSGHAFGPIFDDADPHGDAEDFLAWFRDGSALSAAVIDGKVKLPAPGTDPREYDEADLSRLAAIFRRSRMGEVA